MKVNSPQQKIEIAVANTKKDAAHHKYQGQHLILKGYPHLLDIVLVLLLFLNCTSFKSNLDQVVSYHPLKK